MTRYFVGSNESMDQLFDREGDSLARHNFARPDTSQAPEDYVQKVVVAAEVQAETVIDSAVQPSISLTAFLEQ